MQGVVGYLNYRYVITYASISVIFFSLSYLYFCIPTRYYTECYEYTYTEMKIILYVLRVSSNFVVDCSATGQNRTTIIKYLEYSSVAV